MTIQSLYSNPYNTKINKKNITLQSLYSIPHNIIQNKHNTPPKPKHNNQYSKNPNNIQSKKPNIILPPFHNKTSLKKNPYNIIQHIKHKNPNQIFYLTK